MTELSGYKRVRVLATIAAFSAGIALAVAVPTASWAASSSTTIDFNAPGYTVGALKPGGENGWGNANPAADIALVSNDDFLASGLPAGGRSLRISNAALPSGGAHLVSPLIQSAGETTTNATANVFDATFVVASASGGIQPGLGVDVAVDGASRYGGVINLRHTAGGLQVGSYWVPADATDGSVPSWRSAVFTTVPADVPHTIRTVTIFLDGQPDLVSVYVDGTLVSGGSGVTTWEFYSNFSGSGGDRSADSLSFKTSNSIPSATGVGYDAAPAAPTTSGQGLLFTDIGYGVSVGGPPLPTEAPTLPTAPDPAPDAPVEIPAEAKAGSTIDFSVGGYTPFENAYVTLFSTPTFAGWFQANAAGVVSGTITLPTNLDPGTHTVQVTGALSGFVGASTFTLLALANSGTEAIPAIALGLGLLLGGGLLFSLAMYRRREGLR